MRKTAKSSKEILKTILCLKKKKSKNLNIHYDQNKIFITFYSKLRIENKKSKINLLKNKTTTNNNTTKNEKLANDKIYEAYKSIRPNN